MDVATLSVAVAALVDREDAAWLYDALQAVIKLQVNYPVALVGSAAVVDPLRELARTNPRAFPNLIHLADTKRVALGKPPLTSSPEPDKFDKREYMREFMDKKRLRLRKAVEVENFLRPERDALRGRARLDFMDRKAAEWKADLDARVDRARQASGGRLDAETLDVLRAQFWQYVDDQLEEQMQDARLKLRR